VLDADGAHSFSQAIRVLERDDAPDAEEKSEFVRQRSRFGGRTAEAMHDSAHRVEFVLAQRFDERWKCLTLMKDERHVAHARIRELRFHYFHLNVAWTVIVVEVQARFTDRTRLHRRPCQQRIERLRQIWRSVLGFVRMNSQGPRQAGVVGQLHGSLAVVEIATDRNDGLDACLFCAPEHVIAVVVELGIVDMCVRIDHASPIRNNPCPFPGSFKAKAACLSEAPLREGAETRKVQMISRSDIKKRSYRLLEIAIVISFAMHLLFGGLAMFHRTTIAKLLQQAEKKEQKDVALSTAITIEKRTVPRPEPKPQPVKPEPVPPRPQVQPQAPVAAQPVTKPVPRVDPVPRSAPQELAKIVPRAKEHTAVNKPQVVARINVPHTNPNKLTQAQLNEMNERFSQTIDAARAANDPTHVTTTAPPASMKRAHLNISGINALLTRGEGILSPQSAFAVAGGACYYVNYQIDFGDGTFDSGPVYWPICYARRQDPFYNNWQHFPLPPPQPGWSPSPAQWAVISSHRLLRTYFPGRFPDDNGN